jgi:hypothetical protein
MAAAMAAASLLAGSQMPHDRLLLAVTRRIRVIHKRLLENSDVGAFDPDEE